MDDHNNSQLTPEQKERERREALTLLAQMEEEEKSTRVEKKETSREKPQGNAGAESWKDLIYPEETDKRRKKRQKGSRKKEKPEKEPHAGHVLLRVIAALFAAAAVLGIVLCWIRYSPSREHMDPRLYFQDMMSTGDEQVTLAEDERAIMLETAAASGKARVVGDKIYLDYNVVRENLNSRFFRDEENQMMLFTTALETFEIPVNSSEYTVDGESRTYEVPIVISDERGLYLSADYLALYTNVEYYADDTHVLIRYQWGEQTTAVVKRNSAVRYSGGIKSPILTVAPKGSRVRILEQMTRWSRVVTEDGFIGYIPNRRLGEAVTEEAVREFEEQVYPSIHMDEKVNLVWHMINTAGDNENFSSDTEGMTGVNVISPTWFSLTDNEGNIASLASSEYVRRAHEAGLQVWGLVSNFSPDMSTAALVSSTAARRNLVSNLVDAALECGMDGINVDLEAITEEAGYGYVQFVRELSIACRKNSLVLSVDVPVPFSFNLYYDRKELGAVADYVIVMGYDEHYYGSDAGSVASLSFEENGITETLKEVPAEKIVSGVPFYTRIWYIGTDEEGNPRTWSEELGMRAVYNTLESYGVTPQWDEDAQQYLASWTLDDGIECKIWMEEETSLALKAALVKTYDLGGIAEWVLGKQLDEMWDVISGNIA